MIRQPTEIISGALLVYIHEFEQPPAGIQIMEDGSLSLVANMEGGKARPDLYEPLISQVIDGQDESKLSIAIDEIMSVRNACLFGYKQSASTAGPG